MCAMPRTHPPGPVGPLQGPPWYGSGLSAASGPIRARIRVILLKVSQNGQVSPKSYEKASHSPYSQNGPRKSPLDFLGIPFWPAFSGKELMVPFWPRVVLYCQNDEVSPECTPIMSREVVPDTPTLSPQQAALGDIAPHLVRAVFSTDWVLRVLQEIMTETGIWG